MLCLYSMFYYIYLWYYSAWGWHVCPWHLFSFDFRLTSLLFVAWNAVDEVGLAPLESAVPAADARWKAKANTHTHGRQTAQFSVQCVPCQAAAKACSQQLFNKQSSINLHTCQSCFWCSAAWRHDWTPYHIILQKYAEPLKGRTVHLNCRAKNIVIVSMGPTR